MPKSALQYMSMTRKVLALCRDSEFIRTRLIRLPRITSGLASFCLATVFTVLGSGSVQAQTQWSTAAPNGTWANGANWLGGSAPTQGSSLLFSNSTTYLVTNTLGTTFTNSGITFANYIGGPAYTISGGLLDMQGGITNLATNQQAISAPLANNANILITNSSTGYITFSGNVSGSGTFTAAATNSLARFVVSGGSWSGFAGTLIMQSGRGGWNTNISTTNANFIVNNTNGSTFLGAGTYSLGSLAGIGFITGNANIAVLAVGYNGSNTVWGGNIQSNNTGNVGLTKMGTGTMAITGTNTYIGNTVVSNGVLALGTNGATGRIANSTNIIVSGSGVFAINRSNAVVQGTDFTANTINGTGGFAQIGSGTTILTAANTYSGDTMVSAGALVLSNALAIQNSALNLSGGTISFSSNISSTSFGGLKGSGNLALTNSAGGTIALTLSNTAASAAIYSGNLGGSGGLTLIGSGTQTLSGSNSYSGGTALNAGTLILGSTNAIGSTNGSLTVNGTLDLSGNSVRVGAFTGSTNGVITNSGAFLIFTLGSGNSSGSFGGQINGALSLIKTGSGTQTLSGSNSYTGGTIINGGTLNLNNLNALGIGALTITNATLSNNIQGTPISLNNQNLTIGSSTLALASGGGIYASFTNVNSLIISDSGSRSMITGDMPIGSNALISSSYVFGTNIGY